MEELRKFQSSTFDTIARRKLIEDQNTILQLSCRVQELQNEVNCMNDSKDFQDAETVRSGNSHVTSRPVSFPPHPIPEGMLRHSFVTPRRKEGPPCIWDTHGISGNEVSKKVVNLLRHCQTIQREDDGAVIFWRIKFYLRKQFPQNQYWSDDRWKACLAAGGGSKRRYQYCSDNLGTIIYLRALQGHSGSNLIDPTLQDNVVIGTGIFHYIYHIGCAFNLHSIINNGLIPGGQNSSKRQTVFFLPIDPRDEGHQDPAKIDLTVPRRAQYLHSAWKKHQDAVFWVDIDLAIRKGLTFYQTRSNAIILQGTLPAYCIPKVVRLKTGEVLYEKSYMSPRPPPKISLRHDHDWTRGNDELGCTVEQQPVGKLVQQSCGEVQHATFSQLTQPKPKPICDRSGKPDSTEDVFVVKGETSRSREIDEKGFHGELGSSDRSGKPDDLSENTRVEQTHDRSGQPDERNSSSAHTVKEQFAPEENRDIALLRYSTRTTSSTGQSTRRTSTSTFQDYHILQ